MKVRSTAYTGLSKPTDIEIYTEKIYIFRNTCRELFKMFCNNVCSFVCVLVV
jgi:hypothetical protein